ncbi:hypothetical protein NG726_27540 [Pseudomonas sp. MOB-449]|nr:hypothetical protein [Pseudomonas sp. MOB-449]
MIMHPKFQERNFTIRLGQLMARGAEHFMTTREFTLFDECCKVSARAVSSGITQADLDELERLVNELYPSASKADTSQSSGGTEILNAEEILKAAWPSE